MSSPVIQIQESSESLESSQSVARKNIEKNQRATEQNQDGLMFAFLQVLESVNLQQQTAQTQAKVLSANAAEQLSLNNQAAQLNFDQFSWSALYKHIRFNPCKGEFGVNNLEDKLTPESKAKLAQWEREAKAFARKYGHNKTFKMKTLILTIQKKVSAADMNKISMKNQEVEKDRSFIANQVMLEQQNAQISETALNTTVNTQQQSLQIDSGFLQMLLQVTNQLSTMSR